MNYVIIGNSTAGIACVEGIRQLDKKNKITIITDEPHHTYGRPLISYLLYGKTTEDKMKYRPDSFYKDNNVEVLFGKKAMSIDKMNKRVNLDDGSNIKYDKLLVATGSRPFIPPMEGLDNVKSKFTFMTLDDARALEKAINKDSKVLVVGAGLIGLKCVEGIADRVKSIEVVDLADRILPSILDTEGAAMVQKKLEEKGVTFTLNDCVASFTENTATYKNSGRTVDFDVLVLAVGVRPNTELVSEAGGEVNRGIVIGDDSATTLKDIYAAGDCTECHDIVADINRILALLPNAYRQGETAGINMAGGNAVFDEAIPMNAIGFFGYHIITAGIYEGECYEDIKEETYKKLYVKNNRLVGYILIGDTANAGIYTSIIREKKNLDDIDFDLVKEKPVLMAFSRKDRTEKLGGAH
ncbi:MAG: NAD(P)/FAD-dependent oxidoreductase [Oscillospiraceae bacterium]|nr:NAD(P)/FAD-dependent oxidoreductase [Oscillospiraceae bacterium]